VLEKQVVWFALNLLFVGATTAIVFGVFLSKAVEAELKSPKIQEIIKSATVPKGGIVFFAGPCPENWEDLISSMSGRYVYVDKRAEKGWELYEGDGSHTHVGGNHTHDVTGKTEPIGGGEAMGSPTNNKHAAHMSNTPKIVGVAEPEKSAHKHAGGKHDHRRVGLRMCKA